MTRLEASRAAAVDSAESERRRIERDLHDGAQQRLVALAMDLGRARERFDADPEQAMALVADAHDEAKAALADLRGLVRGIHPAILTDRGLDAALSSVVARSPVPVTLSRRRGPAPAGGGREHGLLRRQRSPRQRGQALTRHQGIRAIVRHGDRLVTEITDDGVGGADPAGAAACTAWPIGSPPSAAAMHVLSPAGGPTTVIVELPCAS